MVEGLCGGDVFPEACNCNAYASILLDSGLRIWIDIVRLRLL